MGRPQPHVEEGTEEVVTTGDRGTEKVSQSVLEAVWHRLILSRHFMFEVLSLNLVYGPDKHVIYSEVYINYSDNYYWYYL